MDLEFAVVPEARGYVPRNFFTLETAQKKACEAAFSSCSITVLRCQPYPRAQQQTLEPAQSVCRVGVSDKPAVVIPPAPVRCTALQLNNVSPSIIFAVPGAYRWVLVHILTQ